MFSFLDWPSTQTPLYGITFSLSLVEMHLYAFYTSFSPEIGCRGNAPLCSGYGTVTDELADSTNPISKPSSAWICHIQLKLWPFL